MRLNFSQRWIVACLAISALAMAGCARKASEVDDAALRAADGDSANWITYGRTYSEQRFSPLKQVDEQSVGKLGLLWSYDLETLRGVEATPLVKDGVLYTTSAWSIVYAFDAKSGKLLWSYDPMVP
jgi:quinohemoprotein ethanol dehydrogenase